MASQRGRAATDEPGPVGVPRLVRASMHGDASHEIQPSAAKARRFLLAVMSAALGACSGGGGASLPAPPSFAPEATILFPGVGLIAPGPAVVRGQASASPEVPIAAMRVNGVSATTSDGFASWQVILADAEGRLLVATTESSLGLTIRRIDVESGTDAVVSGPAAGFGPMIPNNIAVALVLESPTSVLVLTWTTIYRVDLQSGDRSVLSWGGPGGGVPGIGTGPLWFWDGWGGGLAVVDGRILVAASYRITDVDPVSGDRTVIFDIEGRHHPQYDRPVLAALDDGRLFVLGSYGAGASVGNGTCGFVLDLASGQSQVVAH